jgi:uncharacterized membrane protein YvbJ
MKVFTYSCPVCGEEFDSRAEVKEHIKQHGTAEKVSHLALGPNDWLIWYRSKLEERLGLKKKLLIVSLLLILYFIFYFILTQLHQ